MPTPGAGFVAGMKSDLLSDWQPGKRFLVIDEKGVGGAGRPADGFSDNLEREGHHIY